MRRETLHWRDSNLERLLVLVPVRVVEAEGLVDGGALVHELDGAARVGRNVADGQQPVRKMWSSWKDESLNNFFQSENFWNKRVIICYQFYLKFWGRYLLRSKLI